MRRAIALAWASFLIGSLFVFDHAQAQNFQMLYSFQGGTDGSYPAAGLVEDKDGNLYGSTMDGGGTNCDHLGCGTVFELAPNGTESPLLVFSKKPKGRYPESDLIIDEKGNLYGTANQGGNGNCRVKLPGCGLVFEITRRGTEKVLYSFRGGDDGEYPSSGLLADTKGNMYGTTDGGGGGCKDTKGCGTVFKLAPNGKETILYRFQGGNDGRSPAGDLIADAAGNLYGTTAAGGGGHCYKKTGCGTVFELAPDGTETVIYRFKGPFDGDGELPLAGVILDGSGNIYGTTALGGLYCGDGCGTIFRIAPGGTETVLYSFCSQTNCPDGGNPQSGLVLDGADNLYGTTNNGGLINSACTLGCGVVFKVAPDGTETVLHSFDSSEGAHPTGRLITDNMGTLYGMADVGGTNQYGVIFSMTNDR